MVGAGAISQSYAQAFESCERAQLVAVADTRLEAAKALAQGFNCPSYESYQAMKEAEKFEAVIVCTPPTTHPEISTFFLSKGVNVLCEKPLAVDSVNAQKMLDVAQAERRAADHGIQVPLRRGCDPRQEHRHQRHSG